MHGNEYMPFALDEVMLPFTVGRERRGGRWKRGKQGCLFEGEIDGRFVEIRIGSRLDAIRIGSVRNRIEIQVEDVILVEYVFDLEREHDLFEFSGKGFFSREIERPGYLLSDGRPALADAPGSEVGDEGTEKGGSVDARVTEETSIFGGESRLPDDVGNLFM